MYQIKLIKGLSYWGGRDGVIRATKGNPFCEVETIEEAQEAVETGYFTLTGEVKAEVKVQVPLTKEAIDKLNKTELIELAEQHAINLAECKTNDERKEAIIQALGLNEQEEAGVEVSFEEE